MDKKGFTFIEIIISVAFFGILSIALLLSIQFSLKTLFASGQYMQTNYGIQSEMEEFVGTKASSASTDKVLVFEWENSTAVKNFKVRGKAIVISSNSLLLEENFKAFTPYSIMLEY
jgi:prepilin-type N-terminal cleavage/methylation domain-containing protein